MEEGLCARLVQVGIRTLTPHQRDQIARFDVDTIEMQHFAGGARPAIAGPVYLSIDLDGLDPAFAPGVSHREPGGLSVRDVLSMIHGLDGPIVGADVVEFNPVAGSRRRDRIGRGEDRPRNRRRHLLSAKSVRLETRRAYCAPWLTVDSGRLFRDTTATTLALRSLTHANQRHSGYSATTIAIQTAYATHKSHPKSGGNAFAGPPIDGTGCNMNVNADVP